MEASRFFGGCCRHGKRFGLLALAVHCVLMFSVSSAQAWWSKEWELRRQIDLNTTAQGANIAETVTDAPILLRLHSGNFDFKKVKPDGSDLRFIGADDQSPLKFEIDTFDVINEIALIWVKVPEIKANSAENRFYIYYGNEKATDAQDKIGVFSQSQVLVYHLGETQGNPQDATQHKSHATRFSGGQSLPSVVGNGIALFGGQDGIVVPASPAFNLTEGFSFTTWIKITQPASDGYLLAQIEQDQAIVVGINGDKPYARISAGGNSIQTDGNGTLSMGNWHHLAVTAKAGGRLIVYIDGREAAGVSLPTQIPALKSEVHIGAAPGDSHQLPVELDEISLSTVSRSPAWITALFASQGIDSKLVGYGAETVEDGGGAMPTYYLGTIAKNLTVDGWLIIGLLIFFGGAAMLVLANKAYSFHHNRKNNAGFQQSFTRLENVLQLDEELENYTESPLYRVYKAGTDAIARILKNKTNKTTVDLSERDLDYFKTTLEKGFIQETKKLNSWILILTLAISGGPFLGLLGTVWGVMNTFAAMAEAGEANITAIAPGIASALATTVFGLLVAIPALFGYNYLAGKIKDQTADLGIFIDEFTLLVEREHGADK